MKKILLFVLAIVASFSLSAQLIISGVFDGPLSGGVPKVIELYVQSNIADLSIYGLRSTNTAEGSGGSPEFTFPAIAASAGQFISVATTLADFNTYFGYNIVFVNGVASINGDDAIVLYQNGTAFDVFGNPSLDGTGASWDYLDGWAYTANYGRTPSTTFTDTDWLFSGINATDGCTTNATCASVFPTGATSADALPIELSYFNATATTNNQVALAWRTES